MSDQANAGSVAEKPAGNPAPPPADGNNGSVPDGGKSWLDGLSEDNRKLAETKGWTTPESVDKVLSSYGELEKLQGSALKLPAPDAAPEDWDKFYARLPEDRRPIDAPDKLEFKRPADYPEDVPYSDELATASKPWMHEARLNPKQAQLLHDKFTGFMADQAKAQMAAVAQSVEATHDALVKDWGPQDSETFKAKKAYADTALKELGLIDAAKAKGFLLPDGAVTEPQFARAFALVGEKLFKEASIEADGKPTGENPFKRLPDGSRNITAISVLVKADPERAKRLAREAGEIPEAWVPNNPL